MHRSTYYSLACGILPPIIIHVAYWMNKLAGVDLDPAAQCNPYFEGCVSTSGAVRGGPGLVPFKAVMLPVCFLMIITWRAAREFAVELPLATPRRAGVTRTLGIAGALALVIYVLWLGTDGVIYGWLRRYGATMFFGCTALAQLLFARVVWKSSRLQVLIVARALLVVVTLQWIIGILYVGKRVVLENEEIIFRFENILEWWLMVMMSLGFILVGLLFRHAGTRAGNTS